MATNVAGINETDSSGKSSLHLACSGGYLPVVQVLTQQGADLQAVDNEGNNALMHACLGIGDTSTVTWLIEQGLDVNHTNKQGSTAYHSAAGNGHVSLLQVLKYKNANIQAEDESGDNALIRACTFSRDISTVHCLVEQGVQVTHANKGGFTAMHYAAQNGNPEIVKCLLNRDARLINWPTAGRLTPLMLASQNGHMDVVTMLLQLNGGNDNDSEGHRAEDEEGHAGVSTEESGAQIPQMQLVTVSADLGLQPAGSRTNDSSLKPQGGMIVATTDQASNTAKKRRLSGASGAAGTSANQAHAHSNMPKEINKDHLKIDRNNILGKGNFGDVFRGKLQETDVAVKEVAIKSRKRQVVPPSISEEIEISASVRHPNIVTFLGYTYDLQQHWQCLRLVYELIDGKNLEQIIYDDNLKKAYDFTLLKKYDALYQISQALAHLHSQEPKIIHGDVKPSNMIMAKQGSAKLCDLGLSKIKQNKTVSIKTTAVGRGTPIYMAPEQLLHNKSSSTRGDVYSYGASVYEVIFEDWMWDIDDTDDKTEYECIRLRKKVEAEKVPLSLAKQQNHPAHSLIAKCVQFEYENRPEALTLVQELKKLAEKE